MRARTLDGGEIELTQEMLAGLKARLRGPVVVPADAGYDKSRTAVAPPELTLVVLMRMAACRPEGRARAAWTRVAEMQGTVLVAAAVVSMLVASLAAAAPQVHANPAIATHDNATPAGRVDAGQQLVSRFDPIQWKLVAKDGASTPPSQQTTRPARQLVSVGETYDFEIGPLSESAANLWFELRRGSGEMLIQWPVRVR